MKNLLYSVLLIGLLFCFSCNLKTGVKGEGPVNDKTIELKKDFISISLSNGWDVKLKQAEKNSIHIVANQNLIDLFTHKLEKNNLVVSAKNNIGVADRKEITIFHKKELENIETGTGIKLYCNSKSVNTGKLNLSLASGSLTKAQINTDSLNLGLSSGANANLRGNVDFLNCIASSGSNLNAEHLTVQNAKTVASSGANIKIQVNNELTAEASSGGNITYIGAPKKLNKNTSSGGNINAVK